MHTCFQIPHRRTTYVLFALLMVVLALAAFGNLSGHLLNAEGDEQDLLHDVRIIKTHPAYLFSPDRSAPVRPTLDLLFLTAHTLWGDAPAGYHLLQIALHLLASFLLAYTLLKLGADRELALFSALLFLLNVAHFRSVQWVVLINYILAFIFCLIATLNYIRFLESGRQIHRLLALIAISAGVFSHPSAAAIAPFCLYLTWRKQGTLRPLLIQAGPLLLTVLALGVIAYIASPHHQQAEGLVSGLDLRRILENPFWYIGRLLSTAFWLTPAGVGNEPAAWEIGLGILGVLGVCLLYYYRIFPAADWAIWTVIMVLPFANNALDRQIVGPSRQLYLASAGASVALAWALRALVLKIGKERQKQIVFTILLIGLILASGVSLRRAAGIDTWLVGRSYEAVQQFDTALEQYHLAIQEGASVLPSDVYAYLAVAAFGQGRLPHRELAQGLARYPDDPQLNMLMGITVFAQEGAKEGEKQIHRALARAHNNKTLRSQGAVALYNLGINHHYRLKRHSDAVRLFLKALHLQPNYPNACFNLGNAFVALGNLKEAKLAFQAAIECQADHPLAHRNLGVIRFKEGQFEEAISSFQQSVRFSPKDLTSRLALVEAYAKTDRFEQAVQTCQEAIRQYPDSSRTYRKLGVLYYNRGHYSEAASQFQHAVQKAPRDAQANLFLAQTYHLAGSLENADRQYRKTLSMLPDTSAVKQRILAMYAP